MTLRNVLIAGLVVSFALPAAAVAGEIALALEGGYFDMTNSSSSAKAVFDGSSGGPTFGGSLRYGLGKSFFVAAGGRLFSKDGERVALADRAQPVFRLGHPLSVRIIQFGASFGYRFRPGTMFVPYAALGVGAAAYKEESTVGEVKDEGSQTKAAGHLAAGLEFGRSHLRVAVEAAYSLVPNTIGVGGVSKIYAEDDIGGLSVVGKILYVF